MTKTQNFPILYKNHETQVLILSVKKVHLTHFLNVNADLVATFYDNNKDSIQYNWFYND